MTVTRRVTNTADDLAERRVDATELTSEVTVRVGESIVANFDQRVSDDPRFAGLITSMVPDTTIEFGTSLHWGDQSIIWGKGRNQLTVRHTIRVTL